MRQKVNRGFSEAFGVARKDDDHNFVLGWLFAMVACTVYTRDWSHRTSPRKHYKVPVICTMLATTAFQDVSKIVQVKHLHREIICSCVDISAGKMPDLHGKAEPPHQIQPTRSGQEHFLVASRPAYSLATHIVRYPQYERQR